MHSTPARPKLEPLVCPHCAGPVPLADADAVPCPYCGHRVPVPENLRALRRDLNSLAEERRVAEQLSRRVGRPPPRFMRLFLFFDSPWFWMGAFGFWLVIGLAAFLSGVPWLMERALGLNGWDVLSETQQLAIALGGTMGCVALGLLGAGYSRKRVVSLGALQAALAASPPSAPGGPARCRRCAAALTVMPGALAARCDYCRADNLVEIPAEWVRRAGRLVKRIGDEEGSALREVERARRELRTSLLLRLALGGVLTLVPAVSFAFAHPRSVDFDTFDVFAEPDALPVWTRERIPRWDCSRAALYFWRRRDHCRGGECAWGALVALWRRRPYHVYVSDPPAGGEVLLDLHRVHLLDTSWEQVDRRDASPRGVTFVPPLTGWYRVRVIGAGPGAVHVCDSQP